MILIALRIVFGAALAYGFSKVWHNEQDAPQTGDLANAFYLAVCVILAVANALVWAPYFGDRVSGPLTAMMTQGSYSDRKHLLLDLIHWLERRQLRRLTRWCCFLEGVHHPRSPAAFVIGLNNSRKGSWMEKVFALHLFRFDNAQHCLLAYEALRRHRIDPRPHHNPEVNILLLSLEREIRPAPEPISVPPASPAALKRDPRIRLFEMDEPTPAMADLARRTDAEKAETSAPADEVGTIAHGKSEVGQTDERALAAGGDKAGIAEPTRAGSR